MNDIERIQTMYNAFTDNLTFSIRLKKCREFYGMSQEALATEIIRRRELRQSPHQTTDLDLYTGQKNSSTFLFEYSSEEHRNQVLETAGPEFVHKVDLLHDRLNNAKRQINTMRCTIRNWENKDTKNINTVFSINNLRILKQIFNCDYSFLFCETRFPHKETSRLITELGLLPASIEKLTRFAERSTRSNDNVYRYLLYTIDIFCQNDALLKFTSRFFTFLYEDCFEQNSVQLKTNSFLSIYRDLLSHTLQSMQQAPKPTFFAKDKKKTDVILNPAFGFRLRTLMDQRKLKVKELAYLIYEYETEHGLNPPLVDSIEKTIRNWLRKETFSQEIKINLGDFAVLKEVLSCDYEYLLGDTDDVTLPIRDAKSITGLSAKTIEVLSAYNQRQQRSDDSAREAHNILCVLDIILTSDRLLILLCLYFTDLDPHDGDCAEDFLHLPSDYFFRDYVINFCRWKENDHFSMNDFKCTLFDEIFRELTRLHNDQYDYLGSVYFPSTGKLDI